MVGQAEGVVAGRGGDDAPAASRGRQQHERVAGTPLLERSGALEVVELADDARTPVISLSGIDS